MKTEFNKRKAALVAYSIRVAFAFYECVCGDEVMARIIGLQRSQFKSIESAVRWHVAFIHFYTYIKGMNYFRERERNEKRSKIKAL